MVKARMNDNERKDAADGPVGEWKKPGATRRPEIWPMKSAVEDGGTDLEKAV